MTDAPNDSVEELADAIREQNAILAALVESQYQTANEIRALDGHSTTNTTNKRTEHPRNMAERAINRNKPGDSE